MVVGPRQSRGQPQGLGEVGQGGVGVAGGRVRLAPVAERGPVAGLDLQRGAEIRHGRRVPPEQGVDLAPVRQGHRVARLQAQGGVIIGQRLWVLPLEAVDVPPAGEGGRPVRVKPQGRGELPQGAVILAPLGARQAGLQMSLGGAGVERLGGRRPDLALPHLPE